MRFIFIALLGLVILTGCKPSQKVSESRTLTAADYPYIRTFHSGVRYKVKGQIKEAIQAFDSCFRARPTDDAAAFGLAQCYLLINDRANAATYTEIAAKLDPNNIWYTQEIAYMYYNQGKFEEAGKCFQKMIAKEPKNIDWLFGYADIQRRLNQPLEAVKTLDKMEDQLGVIPDISIQKYELYMAARQDDKAIKELEEARKVYPDDLNLIGTLVDHYFSRREVDKAQAMLVEFVKNDPSNGRAHLALGDLYLRQYNKEKAYYHFGMAFDGVGVDIDTKMQLLLSLMEQQPVIDAEVFGLAQKIIEKHPEDAKSYSITGDLLLQNGKKQEALDNYRAALKLDDSKFPIWNQVLLLEYELRRFDDLYTDARSGAALFPNMANVQLLYTIACVQVGRYQEAIDAAEIGKDLVVNDPQTEAEFYAQSGDAYFRLNQLKEGENRYEKALQLDRNNLLTKNNYCMRMAIANYNLARALNMIEEVNQLAPNQAPFIDTKGVVLFMSGDFSEAKKCFEKANELQPNDKNYVEHLGDAYFKLGDAVKAIEMWKKAQQLGSKNKSLDKKIQTKSYVAPVY